ncbi:hypothetical protein BO99DRAFT_212387 [Aspergillus violaceofuscus CBS 115571]|uniref:Uncharacterized protein n=1 Tax=Aspergillus violaceofuscus (strain CBS 115571) TaxID=1450538 RepID=A0A2V5H5I6_ASPV1|nr:hypothetical protein BO99DRAFT_212387 [Aspergillus violaceofuscus CBS 115571]
MPFAVGYVEYLQLFTSDLQINCVEYPRESPACSLTAVLYHLELQSILLVTPHDAFGGLIVALSARYLGFSSALTLLVSRFHKGRLSCLGWLSLIG